MWSNASKKAHENACLVFGNQSIKTDEWEENHNDCDCVREKKCKKISKLPSRKTDFRGPSFGGAVSYSFLVYFQTVNLPKIVPGLFPTTERWVLRKVNVLSYEKKHDNSTVNRYQINLCESPCVANRVIHTPIDPWCEWVNAKTTTITAVGEVAKV